MDKYERLQELKRKVMVRLGYQQEIPAEINKIINESFEQMLNKYEELQCKSFPIEKYAEGNLMYVQNDVYKLLNGSRKTSQMQYFQTFFSILQRELENNNYMENEEKHKEEINNMEPEDKRISIMISDTLDMSLKDVIRSQNRILDSNGYSIDKINNIQQIANGIVSRVKAEGENGIYESLKQDNDELKSWILSQYEEYLQQEKFLSEKEENDKEEKPQREEFTEALDANIGLQEQHDFAKKIVKESEENKENKQTRRLPDNIID